MNKFITERKKFWFNFAKSEGTRKLAGITAVKEYEASHDHLTELLNRRGIEETATRCLELITRLRKNTNRHGCLVFDLKGLKTINSTQGYSKGDQTVKRTASLLKSIFHRPMDIVGRIGGDEFLVISYNIQEKNILSTLSRLRSLAKKKGLFFHIGYSFFKSNDRVTAVIQKVADKTEEAKKGLGKDVTGRLIADTTNIDKL